MVDLDYIFYSRTYLEQPNKNEHSEIASHRMAFHDAQCAYLAPLPNPAPACSLRQHGQSEQRQISDENEHGHVCMVAITVKLNKSRDGTIIIVSD